MVYKKALEVGLVKPLQPRAPPNPLPRSYNSEEYCEYHQGAGHKTDMCKNLRHRIQYVIDNKLILLPKPGPNISTNPLPNYQQAGVSHITSEDTPTDCTTSIKPSESHCCVLDLNDFVDEVNAMT